MTPTPGLRVAAGAHTLELRSGAAVGGRTRINVAHGDMLHVVLTPPARSR
jgi:hypothetical protein